MCGDKGLKYESRVTRPALSQEEKKFHLHKEVAPLCIEYQETARLA